MKIEAFNWQIEVQEDSVRIKKIFNDSESRTIVLDENGYILSSVFAQTIDGNLSDEEMIDLTKRPLIDYDNFNLARLNEEDVEVEQTQYIPTSRSNDQPTDCNGTPLEYGDEMVCVKDFYDSDDFRWGVGAECYYEKQLPTIYHTEFTHSELKNFRKVN